RVGRQPGRPLHRAALVRGDSRGLLGGAPARTYPEYTCRQAEPDHGVMTTAHPPPRRLPGDFWVSQPPLSSNAGCVQLKDFVDCPCQGCGRRLPLLRRRRQTYIPQLSVKGPSSSRQGCVMGWFRSARKWQALGGVLVLAVAVAAAVAWWQGGAILGWYY